MVIKNTLKEETEKLERLKREASKLNTAIVQSKRKIRKLQKENKGLVISDHAMVRYIERVKDIDVEKLKEEILTKELKHQVKTLGDGKYPLSKGGMAVIKNNTIITITP